ncbi:hypothetical protein DFS34DRAFT_676653 [Phlyctochytrium arcticum]|nr:hypothetical protein DFS34DRAFT_676653 [Phlyctochytrium arcticum]
MDDLSKRLRNVASKLRLTDAENEIKLALNSRTACFGSNGQLITRVPTDDDLLQNQQSEKDAKESLLVLLPEDRTVERLKILPGVDPTVALPHNVSCRKVLKSVLQERPQHRRTWKDTMLCPETECILKDTFWYLFFSHWRPTAPAADEQQEKLFARIAQSYVTLLLKSTQKDKDEFCTVYPDILAQAVYCSFRECFPDSTQVFDNPFKTKICDLLSEWMNGLRPTFPHCNKWNIRGEHQGTLPLKLPEGSRDARDGQDASFMNEIMGRSDSTQRDGSKNGQEIVSCPIGPGPQTQRVWFDANGNSGIVERYLGKVERRILTIHRAEVIRETLTSTNPTYRQLIAESVRRSKKLQKAYKASQDEAQREKNRLLQNLNDQLHRERQRIWKILAKPEQVKNSADVIVDEIQKMKEPKSSDLRGVLKISI